ncbi:hypothetical protein D6C97_04727 [Aureobasidium pullulans]|uniref:Histone-lysine N-methyltransferase, H3 lysine-36 specific n=1 Tax=Aureobasidium pullulans TaxID=5580 RepID=A0AB74JVB8_AURPU|nr:hypothetical protein D6D12_04392 [Aureobasidium pullulans]THX65905.1 hypothetical protein D6D11_00155 [Aureobasidium pullulans]THY57528.1 hypothetical protein D6C97_04727 [Aureobasidium pullulans]
MPGPRDARGKSLTTEVEKMDLAVDTSEGAATRESSTVVEDQQARPMSNGGTPRRVKTETPSSKYPSATQSPAVKGEREETIGGDLSIKIEPGKAPKLSRTMSHKIITGPRQLYTDLPDSTDEATSTFEVLPGCTYGAKHLGTTEQALECDCVEEWDAHTQSNHACGEDSDCINRATKMECPEDCGCGDGCENQRFQRKVYADVSVIKTDKKGFGLRANKDLKQNDFIFEYIGEVISEPAFRRRMHQYDQEGIKHFYFMSLSKGEFVDATKKGNLGRFCNHSCNPNCFVDKWVVGDRLRMGIFAERRVEAGEELTFNYNVDRYGADPQPCYCGEPNCSGFIGGKTQTDDRGTQLSSNIQKALGIFGNEDWENAAHTKKPRKKKASEDDEEYIDSIELKQLGPADVKAVMGEIYKNQEKWIIVKLLNRIQSCDNENVLFKVAKMHGYVILNKLLKTYNDDTNILLQILDILNKIPRLTRNKIADSKIDVTVEGLLDNEDERVKSQAGKIFDEWSKLIIAYRIPRVKRDPNLLQQDKRLDRAERKARERSRSRSRSRSIEAPRAPKGPSAKATPSGPRGGGPHRGGGFFQGGSRPPFRSRPHPVELPPGWYVAFDQNGSRYYYDGNGKVQWTPPTQSAVNAPPPPPPRVLSEAQKLEDLIQGIVNKKETPNTDKPSATATPTETPMKAKPDEKWRSLPEEKQKRVYENTLFPSVIHVANKYRGKLDKEDIKRFAKECSKKLVNSDFKNKRVADPYKIDPRQEKAVKKFVTDFFEKAVVKKKEHDQRKGQTSSQGDTEPMQIDSPKAADIDEPTTLADLDDGNDLSAMTSPAVLKRAREEEGSAAGASEGDDQQGKKARVSAPAPPPPPPPPAGDMRDDEMQGTSEDYSSGEGFSIKGAAGGLHQRTTKYAQSPMQVATPPTTNSPDEDERERRRREFSGVNAERMKHLGFLDRSNGR